MKYKLNAPQQKVRGEVGSGEINNCKTATTVVQHVSKYKEKTDFGMSSQFQADSVR